MLWHPWKTVNPFVSLCEQPHRMFVVVCMTAASVSEPQDVCAGRPPCAAHYLLILAILSSSEFCVVPSLNAWSRYIGV